MSGPLPDGLRARFRETGSVRLREMADLVGAMVNGVAARDAVERLARHFHAMAGMGGTYGYPRISQLGDEGEDLIVPLLRSGTAPPAAVLARWEALVREMAEELAVD